MVMTSSRQLWAFARDKGLPFHSFLAKVEPNGLPRNSVVVTLGFTCILALIIIGSPAAFNIILAFGNGGLYTSYLVILTVVIYRRFDGNEFPKTKFSLGKWGLYINAITWCYLAVVMVFCFFPGMPNPTLEYMNWSSLMFGIILLIAGVWYAFRARIEYDGPVEYVRKDVE